MINSRAFGLMAIAAVIAGVGLAGCGETVGEPSTETTVGEAVTIRVLAEDINYTDNMKAMLPDFTEATGIHVDIETAPFADLTSKSLLAFSEQSDTYDVYFNDTSFGSGFLDAGYIEDLAPFEEKGLEFNSFDQFYQPYLDGSSINGTLFGLPVYGESTWLMYRTDLFDEYGIDGPPETMDELATAARTIYEGSDGTIYGITLRGAPGASVYAWSGFLRAFGGDYFDADGELAINSDAAIEATEFYANLLNSYGPPGAASFTWELNRIAFTQGEAAITLDATANGPFNEDPEQSNIVGKVAYVPVPYAVNDPVASNNSLNVHSLFLSTFSKNKDAAYKFMAWATSEEVQNNLVETSEAVGVTLISVLESDAYAQKYPAFKDAVLAQLATGNLDYLPRGQYSSAIQTAVGQAFSQVLAGELSAKEALDRATDDLEQQMR